MQAYRFVPVLQIFVMLIGVATKSKLLKDPRKRNLTPRSAKLLAD